MLKNRTMDKGAPHTQRFKGERNEIIQSPFEAGSSCSGLSRRPSTSL
jgi:hypothetical protein